MKVRCEVQFCNNAAAVTRTWNNKGHFLDLCDEHHRQLTDEQLAEAFPYGNVNTILARAINNLPKGTAMNIQTSLKQLVKTFRRRPVL